MRGRTNISGGITLNATVGNFLVASGNNITGGDFVEYILNSGTTVSLDAKFGSGCFLIDETSHTYLGIIGLYPTLFTYVSGTITIVSQLSVDATQIDKLDATHFVAFNSSSELQANKVFTFSATSTTLTKINETTFTGYGTISAVASKVFVIVGASEMKSYLCDSSFNISNVSTFSLNTGSLLGVTSNAVVVKTYSSSYYYIYVYPINATTGVITNTSGRLSRSENDFGVGFAGYKAINDRYIPIIGNDTYVNLVDVNENVLRGMGKVTTNNSTIRKTSPVNANNEFVLLSIYNSVCSYFAVKIDTTTMSIAVEDTITDNMSASVFYVSLLTDNQFVAFVNDIGYKNVYLYSGNVEFGSPSNVVQQWSGNDNPMGVAKQSGSAGETIEVYIPQVSN